MGNHPMLVGVNGERVATVGGKAAILEEILKRNPKANIHPFEYIASRAHRFPPDGRPRILRESSELDLFGGFGLSASFANLQRQSDLDAAISNMEHPELIDETRVRVYAESVGKNFKKLGSSAMLQVQGAPRFWAVVMQHPNSSNHYIVTYSTSQSIETMVANNERDIRQAIHDAFGIQLKGTDKYWKREQYWAIATKDEIVAGKIHAQAESDTVIRAVREYIALQELGIIPKDKVSIGELGIAKDGIEVYQMTPVRTKSETTKTIDPKILIYGATDPIELPVVKFPRMRSIEQYFRNGTGLENTPDFKAFIEVLKEQNDGITEPPLVPTEFFVHAYVFDREGKYPDGYLAIGPVDARQQFDIPMTGAKVVLLNTEKAPALALNHNTSRLLYKAPVLVVGNLSDKLKDGQKVIFSSEGTTYSIKK